MARWPESAGARQSRLVSKLMTSAAIVALVAGCGPLKQLSGQKLAMPAVNYAPQEHAPLRPTNPLHVATAYWAKQYQKNPNDPTAALSYARNLKAIGARDRALAILKRAYALHSNNPGIASEYGRMVLENGQTRLALRVLKYAERPDGKTDWRTLSALGTAHAKLGEHVLAQQYFLTALQKNPSSASLRNNLALAYAMGGQANKAETLLRKTIENGHDTPRLRQNLALVLGLQRKFTEAKQIAAVDLTEDKAAANVSFLRTMVRDKPVAPAPKNANAEPQQLAQAPLPKRKPSASQAKAKKKARPEQRQLTSQTLPLPWAKKAPQHTGAVTTASLAGPVPLPARKPAVRVASAKPVAKPASEARPAAVVAAKPARKEKPESTASAKPPAAHRWQSDVRLSAWQTTVEPELPKAQKAVFHPFPSLE